MVAHLPHALSLILLALAGGASSTPDSNTAPLPTIPLPAPAFEDAAISTALAQWDRLRRDENASFEEHVAFLTAHPDWPDAARLRQFAAAKADPGRVAPRRIVDFFEHNPPQTPTARARHAEALAMVGRATEAQAAARLAWTSGVIAPPEEARLLGRFGAALTADDQDARMARLLALRSISAAARQISLVSPFRRPMFEARLALLSNRPDAAALADSLGPVALSDPGFLLDKARWLQSSGQPEAARRLLAAPLSLAALPLDRGKWIETLLELARAAQDAGQYDLVYALARNADAAFPADANVSAEPLDLRDAYTSLVWIGAQAALKRLDRPRDALALFDRYGSAARTPQTRSKGLYWVGRAALAAGDPVTATVNFTAAAAFTDQFYGQLAAERVNLSTAAPRLASPPAPTAAERAAFERRELVRAVRLLGQRGQWSDQTMFVRAIAATVETPAEQALAAELSRNMGRPDLGVMVARNLRNKGAADPADMGFPRLALTETGPASWTMIHAIARQESQFDRQIVSRSGARGLMQLMPATAQETATKLGLPYHPARLYDGDYNVMLGSSFFARLLDSFGGHHVLAVAAYNAGPGNVRKWIAVRGDPRDPSVDVIEWIEAIPFPETRGYVQRVLENAVVYDSLNPAGATKPAPHRLSAYLGKSTPG